MAESIISTDRVVNIEKTKAAMRKIVLGIEDSSTKLRIAGVLIDALIVANKTLNSIFSLSANGEILSQNSNSKIEEMIVTRTTTSSVVRDLYSGDFYSSISGKEALKKFFDELQTRSSEEIVNSLSDYEPSKERSYGKVKRHLNIPDEVTESAVEGNGGDDIEIDVPCCIM